MTRPVCNSNWIRSFKLRMANALMLRICKFCLKKLESWKSLVTYSSRLRPPQPWDKTVKFHPYRTSVCSKLAWIMRQITMLAVQRSSSFWINYCLLSIICSPGQNARFVATANGTSKRSHPKMQDHFSRLKKSIERCKKHRLQLLSSPITAAQTELDRSWWTLLSRHCFWFEIRHIQ